MTDVAMFFALAAATLVSEDLTLIAAGILIQQGALDPLLGISACAIGIYVGDLLLYFVGGLFATRALAWRRIREYLTPARVARLRVSYVRYVGLLIVASRFLPGTRLPLYLACGALGGSFKPFACWSLLAVCVWTPAVVLAAARSAAVEVAFDHTWAARALTPVLLLLFWRLGLRLLTRRHRQRFAASVARLWRWEFWPMWVFYAPVAAWVFLLCLRYRGMSAISASNPGIPDGGIVGESKHAILARLPSEWVIPSSRIEAGSVDVRVWRFLDELTRQGWRFPLVFKPDVGQRGAGVRIVRTLEDARLYLEREARAVVAQPYHPGPFEAGVFYYRRPGWSRGRILSITDKHFPSAIGDGHSTLEDLIWEDRRLRMQAATFLTRHAASRDVVLPAGERFQLAIAGNHAQGTLFRDGRHLMTRQLEDRIDAIAASYRGFFIGRFDIRYSDIERFKAGEDLAIVELNGATAESTNVYDPAGSLIGAYRQLFRQWSLVFSIGAANRDSGAPVSSLARLFELLRAHVSSRPAYQISD